MRQFLQALQEFPWVSLLLGLFILTALTILGSMIAEVNKKR